MPSILYWFLPSPSLNGFTGSGFTSARWGSQTYANTVRSPAVFARGEGGVAVGGGGGPEV